MSHVVGLKWRFYNHVVDVDFNGPAYKVVENQVHGLLVCCAGILQAEWHDYPFIGSDSSWTSKRRFVDIFLGHENLIVTCMAVHEGQEFVFCGPVYQEV
ncbi:hypothetical protein ACE6H2_020484 [Prunus campanulata]